MLYSILCNLYGQYIKKSIDIVEISCNLRPDMQTTLSQSSRAAPPRWLEVVAEQVSKLRFGVVQITVHDERVVQIERTEKIRLAPGSAIGPEER